MQRVRVVGAPTPKEFNEQAAKLEAEGFEINHGIKVNMETGGIFADFIKVATEPQCEIHSTEPQLPTLIDVTQDIAGIWIRLTDSAGATVSLFIPNTMTIEQHIKSTMYAAQAAYVRGHHDCRDGKTNLIAGFEEYWDKWEIRMPADHNAVNYTATQMEVDVEGAAQVAPADPKESPEAVLWNYESAKALMLDIVKTTLGGTLPNYPLRLSHHDFREGVWQSIFDKFAGTIGITVPFGFRTFNHLYEMLNWAMGVYEAMHEMPPIKSPEPVQDGWKKTPFDELRDMVANITNSILGKEHNGYAGSVVKFHKWSTRILQSQGMRDEFKKRLNLLIGCNDGDYDWGLMPYIRDVARVAYDHHTRYRTTINRSAITGEA